MWTNGPPIAWRTRVTKESEDSQGWTFDRLERIAMPWLALLPILALLALAGAAAINYDRESSESERCQTLNPTYPFCPTGGWGWRIGAWLWGGLAVLLILLLAGTVLRNAPSRGAFPAVPLAGFLAGNLGFAIALMPLSILAVFPFPLDQTLPFLCVTLSLIFPTFAFLWIAPGPRLWDQVTFILALVEGVIGSSLAIALALALAAPPMIIR